MCLKLSAEGVRAYSINKKAILIPSPNHVIVKYIQSHTNIRLEVFLVLESLSFAFTTEGSTFLGPIWYQHVMFGLA